MGAFNEHAKVMWLYDIVKHLLLTQRQTMDYDKAQAQEKAQMLKDMWNELAGYEEDSFTSKLFESIDRLTNEALPQDEAEQIAQMLKDNLNLNDDIDYLFNYNQQELSQNNEQENLNENSQKQEQEQTQQNTNSQEKTNENTQNKDNPQQNAQENAKNSANSNENENSKEQKEQDYSNFDKRTAYEQGLNGFEKLRAHNEDFANLHKAFELDDKISQEIEKNQKAIEEKEKEIAQKQKKLDETQKEKNADFDPEFNADEIDKNDPLKNEKEHLRRLQDEAKILQEKKNECKRTIQDSITNMFAAKDIYDIMKSLLTILRQIKKARLINQDIKENDKRMKELDELINGYKQRLNKTLQIAGLEKEGKELLYELNKDLYQTQKESTKELENLRLQKQFSDDLNILFKQRTSTTNLDNNTKDIEKLVQKIQKQAPNFEKNYATSFKQAMGIINEKGKTNENTQFQNRSA